MPLAPTVFRSSNAFLLLMLSSCALAQETKVKTLSPRAFHGLPAEIVQALEVRNCRIPQPPTNDKVLRNVIEGEFARKGQKDWAVMCTTPNAESVMVFWNGRKEKPAEIGRFEKTKAPCWREISAVGEQFITDHYKAYGGPKPPPIDHQGVDVGICEKASVTHYYYQGKWLELSGSD